MDVEQRIRLLRRTAIRAEGTGHLRMAMPFRRMAEDSRTGEGAPLSGSPVLGVAAG